MRRSLKYCFIGGLWLLSLLNSYTLTAQIQINEAVSSNTSYSDADGDNPDWFELYNAGPNQSLAEWTITDRLDEPDKWMFPNFELEAEGYIRIWASGKDKEESLTDLHTTFKISAEGETLYLFNQNGILQSSLEIQENIPANHSIGIPLGGMEPKIFVSPTPGSANPSSGLIGVIDSKIEFSHPGGMTEAFLLSLTGVSDNEEIRYTLDASIPDENSTAYTTPISIVEDMVIRVRIFQDEYLPSSTQSKTYLIDKTHNLPTVTLVTEPDNLFHPQSGIYAFGNSFNPNFPFFGANFWEDWERPISFSFYEPEGLLGASSDVGVKIFGGYSRGNNQRSLSLFARKEYGDSKFEYPFFPNLPYEEFEAMTLRNSGNDWLNTNIRDATLTSLMKGSGLDYADNRPVVTYINGEYWGVYHLREKINEHFLASRHDVDPKEITILEREGIELQGSNEEYLDLYNFIKNNDFNSSENYQVVKDQMDVQNYIIYQVAQIYMNNQDWPGNNIKFWKAEGGKWKWILFDTDFAFCPWGFDNYNDDALAAALDSDGPDWPNPPYSTLILRQLTKSIEFRNQFINQFADELNSRFLPDAVVAHIEKSLDAIASEKVAHFNKWDGSLAWHNERVEQMKKFAMNRPLPVRQHIKDQFDLPAFHTLSVKNGNPEKGIVQVNSLLIDDALWTGDYFQSVPINIQAIPAQGYTFNHWIGGDDSTEPQITVDVIMDMELQPVFKEQNQDNVSLIINEINYKSSEDYDAGDWIELYNTGSGTTNLTNYSFSDSLDSHNFSIPSGTIIPGKGFLVLAKDLNKFSAIYPQVKNVIGNFNFGLSSEGDAVRIFDPSGKLKDEVHYLSKEPWPVGANGVGPSLELINPELDNALAEHWDTLHPLGSPGRANIDEIIPPEDADLLYNLNSYPNPFIDNINLTFSISRTTKIEVILYDAIGQLIGRIYDDEIEAGNYEWSESLGELSQGVYFLKMMVGEAEVLVVRMVKG